ncbi:MAG TPA: hypothetical protein VGW78_04330 [Candidatus Babeliales bacterium]|jgi:hypothetical protein|nr:hypothetical protein [Candidatus Babeliales bacterium]
MHYYKTYFAICGTVWLLSIFLHIDARVVIPGSASDSNHTFAIPIKHYITQPDGAIITSAAQPGAGMYAIAYLNRRTKKFDGMMPEKIFVDQSKEPIANPLFDAAIDHIALLPNNNPYFMPLIAISANNPTSAYYFESAQKLLSSSTINDALGKPTGGVITMIGSPITRAFAAVLPHEGEFGQPGTGIAVFGIKRDTKKQNDGKEITTTSCAVLSKAEPLDTTSRGFRWGSPLSSMSLPVSLWWDHAWTLREQRNALSTFLYIGIGSVISGSQESDGACSIGIGINSTQGKMMHITSIFDEHANFIDAGTDKIIIASGSTVELSVHDLTTMWTSTNMRYLIVAGGNGNYASTARMVYALPLVAVGPHEGRLANKNSINKPALRSTDLVCNTEPAAQIGGGPLIAGDIAHIAVRNDMVCALVHDGDHPGIYSSQPIFGSDGTITHWTQWRHAMNIPAQCIDASLSLHDGNWYMLHAPDNVINTISHTQWTSGKDSSWYWAIHQLNTIYMQDKTNIQGIIPFTLHRNDLPMVALLALYSNATIAFAQTGIEHNNGLMIPIDTTLYEQDKKRIIIDYTDPILKQIQPLTSITIGYAADKKDAWFFAAGMHGLAVLKNQETGTGLYSISSNYIGDIVTNMQWNKIGNYESIKKLISDNGYVYALTDTVLYRIDLSESMEAPAHIVASTDSIAGLTGKHYFTDILISDSLALLTTTSGLYRIASGHTITDKNPAWTHILLPEQEFPITRLYPVTTTGNDSDIARYGGSNVYVLSGNEITNRTVCHRLCINPTYNLPVDDYTVQPCMTDEFIHNTPSYCVNFGFAQNLFALDGALTYSVHHNVQSESRLLLPYHSYPLRSDRRFAGSWLQHVAEATTGNLSISCIVRHNTIGAWLLATNKGIRINE